MRAARRPAVVCLSKQIGLSKQKGGENESFHLPGWVLHYEAFGGSAGLPCQAGLRPHSRTVFNKSKGDTTKELQVSLFLALAATRVNGKWPQNPLKAAPTLPKHHLDRGQFCT
jgi:hypothetical protein